MKKKVIILTIASMLCSVLFSFGVNASVVGQTQATGFESALNTDKWNIHSINTDGTPSADKVSVQDGALVFNGAGDGCSFGPTGIYKDFTVRFDVLSVTEGSTFIGFCFGMDNAYDNFWVAGANMVYFQVNTTDAFKDGAPVVESGPVGIGTDNGGGRGWTRPGYELFNVDGPNPEVLNYKVVVTNGSAEVYYKKASDPESELDVLRIRYTGFGDTTGYMKIAATAGAMFTIDNFKIIAEEPVSEDFTGNTIDEDLFSINSINADGTPSADKVSVVNDAVVFNGAGDGCYFAFNNQYKDFILDFDVVTVLEGSTFIGACFGMDNITDNFWVAGANMVYFQVNTTDAFKDAAAILSTDPAVTVGTDSAGRGWTRPGYELYSVDGPNPEVLNYRLIVRNGEAEVYYKKASDPASVLDVLRIRIAGFGDTTGFVKLVSTAGAAYTLDNIKLVPYVDTAAAIAESDINAFQQASTVMTASQTANALDSITLAWDKDDSAVTYRVNVYTVTGTDVFTYVKSIALGDVQTILVDGLTPDTDYAFQVASYDANGFVSNFYTGKTLSTAAPEVTPEDNENPQTSDNGASAILMMLLVAGFAGATAFARKVKA